MSIRQRTIAVSLALIAATVRVQADPPQDSASASGWRTLFNGRSLDGWEHVGPGKFVVEDGALKTEDGMGLLWYAGEKFGDCVIRVVYKTGTERSNSGIYIRIADRPKDPWFAVHHGFEVQIMDSGSQERGTGSIYTFAKANARPAKPGQWNTLEITLKGKQIATTLNGVRVSEFDSSEPHAPGRREDRRRRSGPWPASRVGLHRPPESRQELRRVLQGSLRPTARLRAAMIEDPMTTLA